MTMHPSKWAAAQKAALDARNREAAEAAAQRAVTEAAAQEAAASTVTITCPSGAEAQRITAILRNVRQRGWDMGDAAALKTLLWKSGVTITGPLQRSEAGETQAAMIAYAQESMARYAREHARDNRPRDYQLPGRDAAL